MAKMKVVQVPKRGADFEIVEREIPNPGAGHVRIRVQACGICHSDSVTKDGLFPGMAYPRVPGHEVAGVIDEIGTGVTVWKKGQRVGVGWNAGHDGTCDSCRRGDFALCSNGKVSGVTYDGGYAEYMIAPAEALARIPESLNPIDAAPLLCAGITTFNALRNSGARPGDLVAVFGIGGLGHLGLQFANKFGYHVAAISRGKENAELAKKLGAHIYIDSSATDAAAELKNWAVHGPFWPRCQARKQCRPLSGGWDQTENCWWWERTWKASACPRQKFSLPVTAFKVGIQEVPSTRKIRCVSRNIAVSVP